MTVWIVCNLYDNAILSVHATSDGAEAAATKERARRVARDLPEQSVVVESHTVIRPIEAPSGEGESVELKYRRLLWLGHGHKGIYGDDGEMQCGECMPISRLYDYKRAPLADVERAADAAILAAPVETPPACGVTFRSYHLHGCTRPRGHDGLHDNGIVEWQTPAARSAPPEDRAEIEATRLSDARKRAAPWEGRGKRD